MTIATGSGPSKFLKFTVRIHMRRKYDYPATAWIEERIIKFTETPARDAEIQAICLAIADCTSPHFAVYAEAKEKE